MGEASLEGAIHHAFMGIVMPNMDNARTKRSNLVPMPDGSYKPRENVTDDEIREMAKTDWFGIADKITGEDMAVIQYALDTAQRDSDMWKKRAETMREEMLRNGDAKTRTWRVLMSADCMSALMAADVAVARGKALLSAYEDARLLRGLQEKSSDLLELYRLYVNEAEFGETE